MIAWAVAEHGARTVGRGSHPRSRRRRKAAGGCRPAAGITSASSAPRGCWPGRRCLISTCRYWPGIPPHELEELRRPWLLTSPFLRPGPMHLRQPRRRVRRGAGERVRQFSPPLGRKSNWPGQPRTTGTACCVGGRASAPRLAVPTPPRSRAHCRGWTRCCPGWQASPPDPKLVYPLPAHPVYPLPVHPASSALSVRARVFDAWLAACDAAAAQRPP